MDLVTVYEDEQFAGSTVKIDPTIVQNMGVRIAEVIHGLLAVTVRAVLVLEVPEPAIQQMSRVNASRMQLVVERGNGWYETYLKNFLTGVCFALN